MSFLATHLTGFGSRRATYSAAGVVFDGTNDYMARGGDLSGNSDSKVGLFSAWLNFGGGNATTQYIIQSGGSGAFYIQKDTNNNFQLVGYTTAPALTLGYITAAAITASSGWTHLLFAWDLASARVQCYINGVADAGSTTAASNNNIDYTQANHTLFASSGGGNKTNASVAEFYLNLSTSLDLSDGTNRAKFIQAGKPVSLGSNGSLPTGSQPIIYLKGPAASFNTNLGTGGNFSVTGTLTDAASGP